MVKFTFRLLTASFFLALALLGVAWTVFRVLVSAVPEPMSRAEADGRGEPADATMSLDGRDIF
jgi:hypothetical protein